VQIVSGTKILKIMNGAVNKPVRFVNIITDISQSFIDIYQSDHVFNLANGCFPSEKEKKGNGQRACL
jgi:hypothetical protein